MQLKRDTDYALRLLLCVAKYSEKNGISVSDLSRYASVPRATAHRLCSKLTDAELLKEIKEDTRSFYSVRDDIMNKTLLDVVLATEETVDMFAVFDHSTEVFICGKNEFVLAEHQLTQSLGSISLQKLINRAAAVR